jgi:MFS family permease
VPKTVVYAQVMRSVKNFAALFIASVFFATLFLQITRALRERTRNYLESFNPVKQQVPVALVKPLFFLAVFAEHLSYAFLPQYMRGIALSESWGLSWIAVPFMAFYFCFAMALIPSGRYETRIGSKPLICYGLILALIGVGLMPVIHSLPGMIVLRAIAGIGQGMLFIGVQSYILNSTKADHRTRGASVIVFGFQAGMVSGLAIGSLLVGQIGEKGVFLLSASAMMIALIYTMLIIPAAAARLDVQTQADGASDAWQMMRMIINDWPFLKTMVLIGVPAKGIMTGVVLFAFPLLLSQLGYSKEDIGQLTMLYAIGVLLTSGFASRLVDRSGNTVAVLVIGSFMCAVGLMMFAMLGFAPVKQTLGTGWGQVLLIISAIVLIGFSHGFINAPVVTHIASLELSDRLGQSSVAATYRFLERLGHFGGPLFVGWMLMMHHDSPSVFAWLSIMVLVFGLIFLATANPPRKNLMREEYA